MKKNISIIVGFLSIYLATVLLHNKKVKYYKINTFPSCLAEAMGNKEAVPYMNSKAELRFLTFPLAKESK